MNVANSANLQQVRDWVLPRFLRILFWSLGIFLLIWAYSGSQFRDPEGFLDGTFCLPVSAAVALLILGLLVTGRWRKFAFWFALALVGQAVALQMIDAGPYVRYQHYKPLGNLLSGISSGLLIYLVTQAGFVLAALRKRWLSIRGWLFGNFKLWQLLAIGSVLLFCTATVSRYIPFYIGELFFAAFVQLVNLANVVIMVWAIPGDMLASLKEKFDGIFRPSKNDELYKPGKLDRFAVLAAIWVIVLAATLNCFAYERHPHVPDEALYLYQARYLANGSLTVPAPPVPEGFSFYMIPYRENRWYSIFPPGWPAVLAIGVLLGITWLVNPLLAGVNILLVYILFQELYSRRVARIALFLLCLSPWYIFMAMNFMSHTFTLTCALTAATAISLAMRRGSTLWGWLAGIATGILSLTRPLDGVILGGLLGLWAVGFGGKRLSGFAISGFLLGAVLVGAVILPYNKQITGNPLKLPLAAYYEKYFPPKANALGFGPERGLGWAIDPFPGHSPLESLINANLNTSATNTELFGWSTGSLLIIAIFVFAGKWQKSDCLMTAVIITIFVIYSLYWFSGGPDFGARYWYLMLVPLVVLTARGIQFLEGSFHTGPADSSVDSTRVIVFFLCLCVFALVNFFPWRAIDKYHHYRGMRPDIPYMAAEYGFGKSLVLIRSNSVADYLSAWTYNPLDPWADAPIYAWDKEPEITTKLLEAYHDRPTYIINGPATTQRGYEVIAGPFMPSDLLAKTGLSP